LRLLESFGGKLFADPRNLATITDFSVALASSAAASC
jgi:hypothetical protein